MKNMRQIFYSALYGLVGLLLLGLSICQAALVELDYLSPGDGLLTLDTDTGLKWLDLTETINRTYLSMTTQFGPGGDFEGFRHATGAELSELWTHAGIPHNAPPTIGLLTTSPDTAWEHILLTGVLTGGAFNKVQKGFISDSPPLFLETFWTAGLDARVGGGFDETHAGVYFEALLWEVANDKTGHYLVLEAVPIPATAWLFTSGLIGLIGIARRKKA